jgi:hypothetical protein
MAVFPVAPGQPTFDGNAIHEVWSGKLIENFYASTVLGSIANTDWEGEISDMGSSVKIRTTPEVSVTSYARGGKIAYQQLEPGVVELPIDKSSLWALADEDVSRKQMDIALLDNLTRDAGYRVAIDVDTRVLGAVYLDVPSVNKGATAGKVSAGINLGVDGGTALTITKDTAHEVVAQAMQILDEQDAPPEDRWVVIPAWMKTHVLTGKLIDASVTGDGTSIYRNGRMGVMANATIYHSNLLSKVNATDFRILFGQKRAISFASQFVKTETLRSTETFADLVRGLKVWGVKVTKPEALGVIIGKRG